MEIKVSAIVAVFLVMGVAEGKSQHAESMDLRLGMDPLTLIQRDSLSARLPESAEPDSTSADSSFGDAPSNSFNMPVRKPDGEYKLNMPIQSPPDSVKISMPVVGRDTTCQDQQHPPK